MDTLRITKNGEQTLANKIRSLDEQPELIRKEYSSILKEQDVNPVRIIASYLQAKNLNVYMHGDSHENDKLSSINLLGIGPRKSIEKTMKELETAELRGNAPFHYNNVEFQVQYEGPEHTSQGLMHAYSVSNKNTDSNMSPVSLELIAKYK